ncbi:hypothetical protein PV735_11380 [Streptomyces turgidiscabies]|uniref:Uncharacterized protein n=1 Tax=Streptomyces turgidiscabies (strain Car8) TaxID=698760 RepID=L7ESV8_STRT8|nr:hypothetical protein [Streptomyces turgidiscabies]ELP61796.1 hypothetical protein STRTUCAR8_06454 [Streptomyces turgidiscabies Car8]MDX3493286.1 hypothetical protein [Streptomyces turgidiscabies]GAQ70587.1 hypothetical protein T45_02323 [Streptomyces turgidiscabies]
MDGVFGKEQAGRTRLPEASAQECRRRAEDCLGLGEVDVDVPRAIAWGLLAIAADLHEVRKQLSRKR